MEAGDVIEVLAIVGSCPPERRRLANALARAAGCGVVPARRVAAADDPERALGLVRRVGARDAVVVEFPDDTSPVDVIAAFAGPGAPTSLIGVVCVVDALHVLADLRGEEGGGPQPDVGVQDVEARARLVAHQIEFASTVVVTRWASLPREQVSVILALLGHLSPEARLRLDRSGETPSIEPQVYTVEQARPGWVTLLNGEFDPHMTDPRVGAFRYQQVRPMHPLRLRRFAEERLDAGEFGTVVRSVGFCRLATRPEMVLRWEQAGQTLSLEPLAGDGALQAGEELLSVGQDLAVFGLDLDQPSLTAALDDVAVTDAEFAAGPARWREFPDPFAQWTRSLLEPPRQADG